MVLKEVNFLNMNNKLIIVGAMIIGVLYPFFTDLDIPINPKYILIVASIIGMVLFWEIYGEKKYSEKVGQGYKQPYPHPQFPQQNYPPQQYSYLPPTQNPGYPPYDQEQFPNAEYPQLPIRNPPQPPQYRPKQRQPSFESPPTYEEYTQKDEPEELNQKLPKPSEVVEGKAKLPDTIPTPKDSMIQSKRQSAFKKFGLDR